MKTTTYLRLSLLLPYVLWVLSAGLTVLMNAASHASESQGITTLITLILFLYTVGIFIWGIPYTVLATGLWIWSRGKNAIKMAKVFAFAPLIMGLLVSLEMGIFSRGWEGNNSTYDFGASALAMFALSVGFGYPIAGVVAGVYKIIKSGTFIKDDVEAAPAFVNTK